MITTINEFKKYLNESLSINDVFINPVSGDTYLDYKDYIREKLGDDPDFISEDQIKKLFVHAKIKEIDIKNIYPNQTYLNEDQFQKLSFDLPLGIETNQKIIIYDGHHRIADQILKGQKTIKMKIIK